MKPYKNVDQCKKAAVKMDISENNAARLDSRAAVRSRMGGG